MSNHIPEDWKIKTIAEIGNVVTGSTPSTKEPGYWGGKVPFISPADFDGKIYVDETERTLTETGSQKARLLPKDSILVTCIGSLGGMAMSSRESVTNQQINAVIARENQHSRFHFYNILFNIHELIKSAGTTTLPIINKSTFSQINLLTPPLPEQQKIAAILSSVDGVIEKTRAQIDKLKDLKTGMMQELLTKGIGHTEFKDSPVGRIPKSWEITNLDSIVIPKGLQTGPFGSQLHAHEYVERGVPVVMPKDMKMNRIDPTSIAYIPEARAEQLDKHRVREGDLLFARRGDIGRFALVESKNEGWVCGTGCLKARLSPRINPIFISSYLTLTPVIEWLNLNAVGQTMLNLNTAILADLPIILPPDDEQEIIGDAISALDNRISSCHRKLVSLTRVKSALMQDLLTGKVRVNVSEREYAVA